MGVCNGEVLSGMSNGGPVLRTRPYGPTLQLSTLRHSIGLRGQRLLGGGS